MTGEEPAGTTDFSWKCVFNIEGNKEATTEDDTAIFIRYACLTH